MRLEFRGPDAPSFGHTPKPAQEMRFLGSFISKQPGALCETINHPATFCYRLPDAVSLEEAALLEPLNVALAAVRAAHLRHRYGGATGRRPHALSLSCVCVGASLVSQVKRGGVTIGSRVLVTGAGPVGLITMMAR